MLVRVIATVLALSGASPGLAQSDIEATARAASEQLRAAGDMLTDAVRARDQIAALTRTVRAYEAGLSAMRAGLRQVDIRERALRADFDARRQDIAALLAVLVRIEAAQGPLTLLHPAGPLGTARAGQMIADVTPGLQADADALRADLERLALLQALQAQSTDTLRAGLAGVQNARTALADALSNRTDLPRRFDADGAAMAALIQNADTLAAFADGLMGLPEAEALPIFNVRIGSLPLPVSGARLRGFEEPDAAGISRPGWLVATPARSLVTSPLDATVRYAGPLLDYGQVVILEPARDSLLVLAGMSVTYGSPGDIITAGAPLGIMGGIQAEGSDFLTEIGEVGGTDRRETLYIEVREGNAPVDPATWFAQ